MVVSEIATRRNELPCVEEPLRCAPFVYVHEFCSRSERGRGWCSGGLRERGSKRKERNTRKLNAEEVVRRYG
jgi:hypothetical protein